MNESSHLAGLRVLVAEDEVLLSMLLEEMLEDLGCAVVGPYAALAAALAAADGDDFDVALVDMNLQGESGAPLAERLAARGIPYAIASGGGTSGSGVALSKPYGFDDLVRALTALQAALPRRS